MKNLIILVLGFICVAQSIQISEREEKLLKIERRVSVSADSVTNEAVKNIIDGKLNYKTASGIDLY